MEGYLGPGHRPPGSPTDLALPALDCDTALLARLRHVDKLPPGSEARVFARGVLLFCCAFCFAAAAAQNAAGPLFSPAHGAP